MARRNQLLSQQQNPSNNSGILVGGSGFIEGGNIGNSYSYMAAQGSGS